MLCGDRRLVGRRRWWRRRRRRWLRLGPSGDRERIVGLVEHAVGRVARVKEGGGLRLALPPLLRHGRRVGGGRVKVGRKPVWGCEPSLRRHPPGGKSPAARLDRLWRTEHDVLRRRPLALLAVEGLDVVPAPYDLVAVSGARHVELETVADLDAVLVRAAHVAV